uniref:Cathepsin L15 n=1 Tax=Dysdercus peruvianus TaxID=685034 RepID=A0A7U3NIA5_9HEMI|nr:cathepsin L15 [Dysdercus peruvianus]
MNVILIFAVFSFAVYCHALSSQEEWNNFKFQFNKNYKDIDEENHRMQIFLENKAVIDRHNAKYKRGLVTFEMGMNQYGDRSQIEFESDLLGIDEADGIRLDALITRAEKPEGSLPHRVSTYYTVRFDAENSTAVPKTDPAPKPLSVFDGFVRLMKMLFRLSMDVVETFKETNEIEDWDESVDWQRRGAVTPAKDQGVCGSCWAFSAAGALESHQFIKTGKLTELSVQNLIDCTTGPDYTNLGCSGGIMDASFKYVFDNSGIAKEIDYPYEKKNGTCRYEDWMSSASCSGYIEFSGGEHLREAIRDRGPVSVVLDARTIEFRFYKSGIYISKRCSDWSTNHAVLAVGYGRKDDDGYWLIKNSWGPAWGENGFSKISNRRSCGINKYGIYPLV